MTRKLPGRAAFVAVLAIHPATLHAAPPKSAGKVFSAPGQNWSLVLPLSGYEIVQNTVDTSGTMRYVMSASDKTGLSVSFWIEPMTKHWKSSKACRKDAWAKEVTSPVPKKNIKMWEQGDFAVVEYDVQLANAPLIDKNYHAYMVHDKYWVDIHISKMPMNAKDEAAVRKFLENVHVSEGAAAEDPVNVMTELRTAGRLYEQKEFKRAAVHFQKAFDSEKKHRTLDQNMWRFTVDSLGMCYGMTDQLPKAESVLKYGISQDSKYAMFHYNLACTYAEMDDLDRVLPCLEKAIEYKDNQIKGEQFPDPRKDDSFKKYLRNKRFIAVVKKLDE